MDIYQLKQFVTLAETGNMTETAQKLFISQPNISRSIKKLEEELGLALFIRARYKMILTPGGEYVFEHARKALAEIEKIQNVKNAMFPDNTLILAGVGSIYFEVMIPEIAPLLPGYKLVSRVRKNWEDLQAFLFNDECHIVVTGDVGSLGPEFETEYFFRETYCVSVPVDHPFYSKESLHLSDLEGQNFILSSHQEARYSNHLLKKHNISVNAVYTTDQPVNELKVLNSGALIFESSICRARHAAVFNRKLIPLLDEDCSFDVYLTYKRKNKAFCAPLIQLLIDHYGSPY